MEEGPIEPTPNERAPDALLGLWRRTVLELAEPGGDFRTTTGAEHVLWFQTPTRYADFRFGDVTSFEHGAFCGRQHWDWPRVRFHHEIDTSGVFQNDEGTLELLDERTLIETGEVELEGRKLRLRERWERQPLAPPAGESPELRASEYRGKDSGDLRGLRLDVGQYIALVYRFTGRGAVCWERTGSRLIEHVVFGDPSRRPEWRHFADLERETITPFEG